MTNVSTTLTATTEPTEIDADTDGRTLRRRRNRDAVITSLIELIDEGDLDPTVAKIADRAAVSHRSIFRYFDDLDDLARTAIETAVRQSLPMTVIPNLGAGSLADRIEAMVTSRVHLLKQTSRLLRVAHRKSTTVPEIDRGLATTAEMTHDQLTRHFAAEFDGMEPAIAEQLSLALSAMMGFGGYDHQSRLLGRIDDEIADSWRTTLHRLLG